MAQVQLMVDSGIRRWSDAFYSDYESSTTKVSNKVSGIGDAVTVAFGSCSYDTSDSASDVELPSHEAQLLDRLRATDAATYARLLGWAQLLNDTVPAGAPASERRAFLERAANEMLAEFAVRRPKKPA
jgi:hypothetical protein